jgi:hypothetical protein
MTNRKAYQAGSILLAAQLTMAALGGCAMSDDKMASFLVAPGKYELYTCPELVERAKGVAKRQRELEKLMAKAGQESSGRLVSALAYRPEYLSTQGELKDVRAAAVAKSCDMAAITNAEVNPDSDAAPADTGGTKPSRATIQR